MEEEKIQLTGHHHLAQAYIARIEQINHVVHAVSEINPDALEIARDLDTQRGDGTIVG